MTLLRTPSWRASHALRSYCVLLLMLLLLSPSLHARRCYLNKTTYKGGHWSPDANAELGPFCGCSGLSQTQGFPWTLVLPPHTGTATTTGFLHGLGNITSCEEEHAFLALHETERDKFRAYCASPRKSPTYDKLCFAYADTDKHPEFVAVLARNPYLRVLTSATWSKAFNTTAANPSPEADIERFRAWVKRGGERFPHRDWRTDDHGEKNFDNQVAPITTMLTMKNGLVRRPDFVIYNDARAVYAASLFNFMRVLGYGNALSFARIEENEDKGTGHHFTSDARKKVPLDAYYDEATAAIVYNAYKADFDMFHFEINVSRVVEE
jgi:hypothetical protein